MLEKANKTRNFKKAFEIKLFWILWIEKETFLKYKILNIKIYNIYN